MLIHSDYILPTELTGYVRASLADLEENQFTLSDWLPSDAIDDLEYRFTRGGQGLAEAATVRAYDTESPIGSRPGIARISGELPPISRKILLGEYARLRQRKADQAIVDAILRDAEAMTLAVAARVELFRGEALYKGKYEINENGVITTVDFGRSGSHTVSAAIAWSDLTNAVPITNLLAWRDVYVATNGVRPGSTLMSSRALTYLMQNAQVRNLVFPGANQPSIVTEDAVRAVMVSLGLPPIYTNDEQIKVSGVATRVIPEDRVLLLPARGRSQLGATLWGTTAESLEEGYALAGDEPGIVAGAYSTNDPVGLWTKASGIALPILANPDLSFAADVFA